MLHRSSRKIIKWNVPNDNSNYSLCAKFYVSAIWYAECSVATQRTVAIIKHAMNNYTQFTILYVWHTAHRTSTNKEPENQLSRIEMRDAMRRMPPNGKKARARAYALNVYHFTLLRDNLTTKCVNSFACRVRATLYHYTWRSDRPFCNISVRRKIICWRFW